MDLQNTFYFFGIIFMSLSILILLGIVVILFLIMAAIKGIHGNIVRKIDDLADKATNSSNLAVNIGTALAGSVIRKAKESFHKDK